MLVLFAICVSVIWFPGHYERLLYLLGSDFVTQLAEV